MTKRSKDLYHNRKELESNGWGVVKSSRYNSGSETLAHSVCKLITGHYLKHDCGYKVDFEVEHPTRGEIDVLAWGETDSICVECETNPSDDTISDKIDRYVTGTPIRDMFLLNVDNLPVGWTEAYLWIDEQLYDIL